MGNLLVSMGVKGKYTGIVILSNGKVVLKRCERLNIGTDNIGLAHIESYVKTLRILRNYLQNNKDERDIVFETSSSQLIKWVDEGFSKADYVDWFDEAMNLLQSLPIRYYFVQSNKPVALQFTGESFLTREKVSGLL